jgi:putative transposase
MKRSRFTVKQIIGVLREMQAGTTLKEVCAKHNIREQTYYGWKRMYGEARRLKGLEEENQWLKRLVADYAVQIQILKEVNAKKMVSPSNRRRAVCYCVEEGVSLTATACRALGLARSTFYRGGNLSQESRAMHQEKLGLSEQHPRYSYEPPPPSLGFAGFDQDETPLQINFLPVQSA